MHFFTKLFSVGWSGICKSREREREREAGGCCELWCILLLLLLRRHVYKTS